MADRENSMESPAPEEMPLVLAYPADGGPREQSPNVVLRALPPSVAVNMSTILVGARVIDWPALMRQLQDEASQQGWTCFGVFPHGKCLNDEGAELVVVVQTILKNPYQSNCTHDHKLQ